MPTQNKDGSWKLSEKEIAELKSAKYRRHARIARFTTEREASTKFAKLMSADREGGE